MSPATTESAPEDRIATLEGRLAEVVENLDGELRQIEARMRRIESDDARRPGAPTAHRAGTPSPAPSPVIHRSAPDPAPAPTGEVSERALGDLVGGRILAWLGGTATLLGIILFLALAISHGWIGETARVLLAGAASGALMAAGVWLHEHRGRTEAAVVMVATASAGSFATLFVASAVYELIPAPLAVAGALALGALAITLAIRWGRSAIGGLGLGGALLSGILVGAPMDTTTIAILAITASCAMWVVVRQRWGWLALGTVAICAPQWAVWAFAGQSAVLTTVGLGAFAAIGLLGAIGAGRDATAGRALRWAAATAALSAFILALVGWVALGEAAGATAAGIWLTALAGLHLAGGSPALRRASVPVALGNTLTAIGLVLGDVAFGLSAEGLTLAIGWSASAVLFAWLGHRDRSEHGQAALLRLGVGAQIGLALIRALIDAPPQELLTGQAGLPALLSIASLAAACLVCGQLSDRERSTWRTILDAAGFTAIAYLTASALDGPALAVALAGEALALTRLNARAPDRVTDFAALAFTAGAALQALIFEAPPVALITGEAQLGDAAVALAALALLGLGAGRVAAVGSQRRSLALVGAGSSLLYLASLAIVVALGSTAATATDTVLELGVRQQAQVALSGFWSLAGLGALIVGLRLGSGETRTAGLTLLLMTVAKVFLYDLSTLTSVYRVVSFIVLGLLLLLGAFAYQRLRPPAPRPANPAV